MALVLRDGRNGGHGRRVEISQCIIRGFEYLTKRLISSVEYQSCANVVIPSVRLVSLLVDVHTQRSGSKPPDGNATLSKQRWQYVPLTSESDTTSSMETQKIMLYE